MDSELRQYIRTALLSQATVRHVQSRLPDDAELDRWLQEAADGRLIDEFIFLALATLVDERPLDARHLVHGAGMIDAAGLLPQVAIRATGDTPKFLLQAARDSGIDPRGRAYSLVLAAVLARERGGEIPPEISVAARSMLRDGSVDSEAPPILHGLAAFLRDDVLAGEIRRQHYPKTPDHQWRALSQTAQGLSERLLKTRRKPMIEAIPERMARVLASGHETVRRAAARLGRNEPCHCGSGKKYKQCHLEKDQERLRESSSVEGLTKSEQDSMPEEYLTRERLQLMAINRLTAIDPLRVPFELLPDYFERLGATKEFDRAAKAFEEIGYYDELEKTWSMLVSVSIFAGHRDAALRLIQVRRDAGYEDDDSPPLYQFFIFDGDLAKSWEWIDRQALKALKSGEADDLRSLANGVLLSKHVALGILLGRGVIPLLKTRAEASGMLEPLLAARENLNLGADEPIGDVIDLLWAARSDATESDSEVRDLQELFALKRREADELKQTLERVRREARRSEEALKKVDSARPAGPAEQVDPEVLKESRRKMNAMEHTIREKNEELQNMRRELVRKDAEAEARKNQELEDSKVAETDSAAGAEEDLLLPQESEIHQPLRLIEFPRNFEQRLSAVPRHIARKTLAKLGGLAGGEPSEFVGAVRLKGCPSVTRVRIGIDHRLLFRLLADRIQVVDLIPRSDLERKVKILATQYD